MLILAIINGNFWPKTSDNIIEGKGKTMLKGLYQKFTITLIMLLGLSSAHAEVTLAQVAGEFLSIHGANWNAMAQTSDDWSKVRYWHEQIIDDPEIVLTVMSDSGMPAYISTAAIPSYGRLIGEGIITLDAKAISIFDKVSIGINDKSESVRAAILAGISLTNSPWGMEKLRNLVKEDEIGRAHV